MTSFGGGRNMAKDLRQQAMSPVGDEAVTGHPVHQEPPLTQELLADIVKATADRGQLFHLDGNDVAKMDPETGMVYLPMRVSQFDIAQSLLALPVEDLKDLIVSVLQMEVSIQRQVRVQAREMMRAKEGIEAKARKRRA